MEQNVMYNSKTLPLNSSLTVPQSVFNYNATFLKSFTVTTACYAVSILISTAAKNIKTKRRCMEKSR